MEDLITRLKKPKVTPVWEKDLLTIDEANAYTGIGRNKLLELTERRGCKFVIWNGNTRFIKRVKFEEFLDNARSI